MMKHLRRFQPFLIPGVIALFVVYPFLVGNYLVDAAFFFGIYALLGLSLNIVLGEVGLFDLGHAGFFAIGAYTTAILNTQLGLPVLLLLPISACSAALFAFLVTSPIIHLRGDYLCIVTIGVGEIVRLALINNPFDLTGGPNGIFGIDFPSLGPLRIDSSIGYYYLVWIVGGLSIIALVRLQTMCARLQRLGLQSDQQHSAAYHRKEQGDQRSGCTRLRHLTTHCSGSRNSELSNFSNLSVRDYLHYRNGSR